MVAQGVLDFQYEADSSRHGLTSLAGLPVYFDLIKASGLGEAIRRHVRAAGGQGWLDIQMVLAVIFLNLAGGDCVEDIERLERDGGFSAVLRAIEKDLLSRAERRSLKSRWRRERERATPSPSALSGWLERFHDPASPKAVAGTAFIPAVTEELRGLWRVNQALLEFLQNASARDDGDAGHGRDADRDAQARRAVLLQEVQGVSAAELLVGGTGRDALFGVPRRQRARRTRAVARAEGQPAPSARAA